MLWASGFASESLPAVALSNFEETQKTIIFEKNRSSECAKVALGTQGAAHIRDTLLISVPQAHAWCSLRVSVVALLSRVLALPTLCPKFFDLAQPIVCRENIGRTAQRCQPGTTPTRALSAPEWRPREAGCSRSIMDRGRSIRSELEAGKVQPLDNGSRWLQRHESAKPALAAEEEQREREQKAAHAIKMKAMAAAEEVQMARPTICSAW
jgi:hypothetical protein